MRWFTLLVIGILCPTSILFGQEKIPLRWSVISGLDYSSGDYREDDSTDILYVSQSVSLHRGQTAFRVTVPWLQIEGPSNILTPRAENVTEDDLEGRRSESGLGDVQLSLSTTVKSFGEPLYLTPSVSVKIPTADEDKRLGTGETDVWLRLNASWQWPGRLSTYASGGYRWMGSSEDYPLSDRAFGGVGLYKMFGRLGVGGGYDFQERSFELFEDQHELGAYLSRSFGTWRSTLYGRTGLTNSSPDYNVGLQLGYEFR